MFGLALRSYQHKRQRLSESTTSPGKTLWEAVFEYLREHEVATRAEVLRRFTRDDDAIVKSVLQDLVESGLVYKTGTRQGSVYRIAPDDDVKRIANSPRALEAALWFRIYREGPISRSALLDTAKAEAAEIDAALAELTDSGRVRITSGSPEAKYNCHECAIPIGDEEAWAPNVVNHFQMVTSAICAKLANGKTRAQPDEELGGSSYSFNVWPGHPFEERARQLLSSTRKQVGALWDEIAAHNREQGLDGKAVSRVNFYFGQSVIDISGEES
jgi:hypothetical protein